MYQIKQYLNVKAWTYFQKQLIKKENVTTNIVKATSKSKI